MDDVSVRLTPEKLDAAAIENSVRNPAAGATVSFVGVTRNSHAGRPVLRLEYEAQEKMALAEMRRLAGEAKKQFKLIHAAIEHRVGVIEIGEPSVVIAVSSAHRAEAFEGCRFLIDSLKTSVPIWKKEHYADGSEPKWVGPDGKLVE